MSASAECPGASNAISGSPASSGAQFLIQRDIAAEQGEPDDHADPPRNSSRSSPRSPATGQCERDGYRRPHGHRDAARVLAGG